MPVSHGPRSARHDGAVASRAASQVPPACRQLLSDDEFGIEQQAINDLIRRVQNDRDPDALAELMRVFDWLAVSCAQRMHWRDEPIDDLEQVAREALLGAISRFDLERGIPFRTYAWATTVGVLRRHYRSRWQVHVPRGLQELNLAAMRAIEELTASAGRSPTVDAIASRLGASREEVLLALEAGHAYRAGTLDAPSTSRRITAGHADEALSTLDDAIETVADRTRVRELLSTLPPRHQTVLVMRFFEERTQLEIGQSLGVSQVQVSRLMRSALNSLRERVGAA